MSNEEINWESLSDEQIEAMEAPPSASSADAGDDLPAEVESSEEPELEGNAPEETDGADPEEQPEEEGDEELGDEDGESGEIDTPDPYLEREGLPATDDQSEEEQEAETDETDPDSDLQDYKSLYEEVMAPFKAAGREVQLDSPDQVRRLLQMGVDYNQKMQHMKPYMKTLRTLEKANLLSIDKINFLIDLDQKNPEAIKKLLSDSSIDPMELDTEDDTDYSPNDHSVSDTEMGLKEVFESLKTTPTFEKTMNILVKEWDVKSQNVLADNPATITELHTHIANGTYDTVWAEVVKRRLLGELPGLSDLDAYNQTGAAMVQSGQLQVAPAAQQRQTSPAMRTTQPSAQGKGSPQTGRKARKRAAAPTGGTGRGRPQMQKMPDFANMTDEEIEAFDINSLP